MMKNKRHKRVIFNGRVPVALGIMLAAVGVGVGLLLYNVLSRPETDVGGRHDETALSVQDSRDEAQAASAGEPTDIGEPDSDKNNGTADEKVLAYVASMPLREKLCQMLIVTPDAIAGIPDADTSGPAIKSALEHYPVGGLIHFAQNITSGEEITLYNSNAQSYSKTPMFIAVDEEGGRVSRLQVTLGAHSVGAMLSYEKYGETGASGNAKTLANALRRYGFNTDFAPVADVWSNPANTVIGDRAYSSDFDSAARLVSAAVSGFHEGNIVCSIKHFPGHGDTREDSHDGTAFVHKTLDELRAGEFKPFAAGIEAGADMVMVGHLVVPAVEELPATLSKKLVTGVLRDELGFGGVVITDALEMGAISSKYSAEYVAVTAVNAGVDILLMPDGIDKTISALTSAIESGEISESRIDESVVRIIGLKAARGIIAL